MGISTELMDRGVVYVNEVLTNTGQLLGYYDCMNMYHIAINLWISMI